MKRILPLLVLLSVSFSYVGHLTVAVEKTWVIESGSAELRDFEMNSTFLALSPHQRIVQLNGSEGLEFPEEGGNLRAYYFSESEETPVILTATALVEISYGPNAASDPPFSASELPASGDIAYSGEMRSFALSQTSGSTGQLEAATSLADWVYLALEYNLSRWGEKAPAEQVYALRSAVCTGYSHLFISLARSVGLEARYVSGRAFSEQWQDHAWAEVKIGGQWVPADPTFHEFGMLDARHIAFSYSDDQSGAFDKVTAKGGELAFTNAVHTRIERQEPYEETIIAYTALEGESLNVVLNNPTKYYLTPTFDLRMPEYINKGESRILVLAPGERKVLTYELDTRSLTPGYTHTIPYTIAFQGTTIKDDIVITKSKDGAVAGEYASPEPGADLATCPVAFAMLAALFLSATRSQSWAPGNRCS